MSIRVYRRYVAAERYVVTTTVLDPAAGAGETTGAPVCTPAICRVGLLGFGNIGSAVARLSRDAAPELAARGLAPIVVTSLVRTASRVRPHAALAGTVTDSPDRFFAEPVDVIVEALGGVEPAFTLVRRALDRGIPVVTANKSLVAAHGDDLARLAQRRGTALRYEAACIAGVPFLGTFERRALASGASAVTAILNGTSNYILSSMTRGGSFAAALADAQRLGYAEPDPTMDVSGADAAEKLAILVRLFGRLLVNPAAIACDSLAGVEPDDVAAAAAFGGAIRPVSRAAWTGTAIRAHVGPAFLSASHPLGRVSGVTNGVVIDGDRGAQCYIGPGAGPDVTAATLLDDVSEVMADGRAWTRVSAAVRAASSIARPDSDWFIRLAGGTRPSDLADLLGSYGIWCARLERRDGRVYALTCQATPARLRAALDAVQAATGAAAAAFPALDGESVS